MLDPRTVLHFVFEIKLIFTAACKLSVVYYLEYKHTFLCLCVI